jgi:hypothetical protein
MLGNFGDFLAMALPRIGLVGIGTAAGVYLVELLNPVSPRGAGIVERLRSRLRRLR